MTQKYSYVLGELKENHPIEKVDGGLESNDKITTDYDVTEWNGNIDIKKFERWFFTGFIAIILWILIIIFLIN